MKARTRKGPAPYPPALRRNAALRVYVTKREQALIRKAAGFDRVSEWARSILLAAAERALR